MISQKTLEFEKNLKASFVPVLDWKNMDWNLAREKFNLQLKDLPIPENVIVTSDVLGGIEVERIKVPNDTGKVIFHIHGGGMTMGNCSSGRFMLSHIGVLCGRNTVSVNYRLCPEYSQPAAVEDCAAAYRGLLREYAPKDIALIGESAGGMLVLALLAYIKVHNLAMPGCACVISGSADPEYKSASMTENKDSECVVCLNLKEVMSEYYYCDGDLSDPVLNPLNSDVSGWPPVFFHACREEILRDESVRMYEKLKDAGVPAKLSIKDNLFHTYMMFDLPESYDAFQEFADFFKENE